MTYQENEQWKSNGDCYKCRRKSYCSKKCTVKKNREHLMLENAIRNVMPPLGEYASSIYANMR